MSVHAKHPRPLPKGTSLTNGRVLHRPHRYITDDPMAWFVTAVHTPLTGSLCTPIHKPEKLGELLRAIDAFEC